MYIYLRTAPFYWKLNSLRGRVFVVLYKPRQPEVSYLDDLLVTNKAVPGSQISVDEPAVLEVLHGRGDLSAHVNNWVNKLVNVTELIVIVINVTCCWLLFIIWK